MNPHGFLEFLSKSFCCFGPAQFLFARFFFKKIPLLNIKTVCRKVINKIMTSAKTENIFEKTMFIMIQCTVLEIFINCRFKNRRKKIFDGKELFDLRARKKMGGCLSIMKRFNPEPVAADEDDLFFRIINRE